MLKILPNIKKGNAKFVILSFYYYSFALIFFAGSLYKLLHIRHSWICSSTGLKLTDYRNAVL